MTLEDYKITIRRGLFGLWIWTIEKPDGTKLGPPLGQPTREQAELDALRRVQRLAERPETLTGAELAERVARRQRGAQT